MSRCSRPAACTAAIARHSSTPMRHGLCRREGLARRRALLERLPLDELHPQADAIVDLLGAVDGHDVGVADAGQQAALFDDRAGPARGVTGGRQELQRHFAVEPRVPRAIDLAEGAGAEALGDTKVAPVGAGVGSRTVAVQVGDARRGPSAGRATGDRPGSTPDSITGQSMGSPSRMARGEIGGDRVSSHLSSPRPGAPAPAGRPCAPHPSSACRGPRRAPRSCSPARPWR